MPPRKRDKDVDSVKNPQMDHAQADHELFLQAFEKPTQIYRFLAARNIVSPIFMSRTLTYMKERMSRSRNSRTSYKTASLLDRVLSRQKDQPSIKLPAYMNVTFMGFFDKSVDSTTFVAEIEAYLVKISHKKRKDSVSQTMQDLVGTVQVVINPGENQQPNLVPTICVTSESFGASTGDTMVKSYLLLLHVRCVSAPLNQTENEGGIITKRRKSVCSRLYDQSKLFFSEMTIYDKQGRCILTDGDYEVCLQEVSPTPRSPRKQSSWENISDLGDCGNLDDCMKGPRIKFRLIWSDNKVNRFVDRPKPYPIVENTENATTAVSVRQDKQKIIYQFIYNNNARQQAEPSDLLNCPWCTLKCDSLYTLLKHLKLCHSRFTFTYVPISIGARIDVAINELYDGSYTGAPNDLISQTSGRAFSRNGPVRRAAVTHILVCHPKRSKPSLSEFLELDDCEYDGQRPFVTGHNRLYHHTNTCLPIYPKEMDVDSENENDPEWLRAKTMMMIDDFTDVNEGEKELFKMWNLHVMKYGFVGDCQIPLACSMFVQHKGRELLHKNLYRNFVLHLCSLFDFGLISAVCLYQTIQKMQELIGETGSIRNVLRSSREAQIEAWAKISSNSQEKNEGKTPATPSKKAGSSGMSRRKRASTPSESPNRRKSICSEAKKRRLSVSLTKSDQKTNGS